LNGVDLNFRTCAFYELALLRAVLFAVGSARGYFQSKGFRNSYFNDMLELGQLDYGECQSTQMAGVLERVERHLNAKAKPAAAPV